MPDASGNRGLANRIGRIAHLVAFALILTMPLAAPPVRAEDERPDLHVKLRGLDGQRDVKLSITNDSDWWANETTVTVETLSPGSSNPKTLFVENLDPGQTTSVTYTLGADCDGHRVKAVVATAKNYEGVLENNLGNNRLDSVQVCPPKGGVPKPEPKPEQPNPSGGLLETGPRGPVVSTDTGVVVRSVPSDLVIAEHLKPGTHTLDFKPSELMSVWNLKYYNTLPEVTPNPQSIGWTPTHGDRAQTPLIVGWAQNEDNWIYPRFRAYQVLMRFDLELLDQVPTKLVSRAAITYDETPDEWTNEEGDGENKTGCATSLGRFRFETDFNSVRGLIETEYVNDIPEGGQATNVLRQILGREVNVTSHLLGYVKDPSFLTYAPNFVLRPELDDGEADDNEACLSTVSNIQLHVTFTVPDP